MSRRGVEPRNVPSGRRHIPEAVQERKYSLLQASATRRNQLVENRPAAPHALSLPVQGVEQTPSRTRSSPPDGFFAGRERHRPELEETSRNTAPGGLPGGGGPPPRSNGAAPAGAPCDC